MIKMVVCNNAFNDTESTGNRLSAFQFPDSIITKRMRIGHTKCKYILNAVADGMQKVFTDENVANSIFFGMGIDESTKANKAKLEANVTYHANGLSGAHI